MCAEFFRRSERAVEMTELVTINAAREAQQLAILAQRPSATPGEHKQHNAIQITQAGVQPDARRAAQGAEAGAQGNSQQDPSRNNDRNDSGLTGPSRPVVQVAAFDSGPEKTRPTVTPDLFPSAPVATGKSSVGPANSLATSPIVDGQTQAEVDVAIAQRALQTPAFERLSSSDTSARNIRLEAAARAVRADASIAIFGYAPTPNQSPEAELQKFSDKAAAAQGTFAGDSPVDKKFYGQGVEAVVGQFAGPEQPQKYADKAAATDTPVSFEDGSGQAKFADKVAQTDTNFAGGQQQDQQKSYFDRAQEATTAAASIDPNKARPELSLYGAVPSPTPSTVATPVQVTA